MFWARFHSLGGFKNTSIRIFPTAVCSLILWFSVVQKVDLNCESVELCEWLYLWNIKRVEYVSHTVLYLAYIFLTHRITDDSLRVLYICFEICILYALEPFALGAIYIILFTSFNNFYTSTNPFPLPRPVSPHPYLFTSFNNFYNSQPSPCHPACPLSLSVFDAVM